MSKKYCLITAVTLAALNSYATVGSWTADAAGNWSDSTKWSGGIPTAAGDTANLTNNITAARTVTIDTTSRTVGTLTIGDPTSSFFAYTLAVSGGATLTFNNNGSGALLAKPTAANTALDVINAPISLADNLTIDTAVTGTGNSGNSLQFGGVISGTGSLTKNGAGGIYMNQGTANTYTGGTILNAGEIQFSSSFAFGTGPLIINGGSLAARIASRTLTNAVTVNGDFACNSADAGGNALTLSGNIDFGSATRTLTVASTANPSALITGNISGGNSSVGLIKAGASTLLLSGMNTYSGDTRIAAGSLQLSTNAAAPAGASLALQNSTLDMNAADAGTLSFRGSAPTVAATLGGLKGTRDVVLTNTSGASVALTVGNNGQSTTYSGALSGPGGSLVKSGPGTLTLSGTNTYDGATTISGGTLALSANGSLSKTPLLSIAAGATFDVSGLASTFTLGAGQSISNSLGTVNGPVATTAGSSIYPATVGIPGTLSFNGNLNLSAGGTVTFDLNPSGVGGNDLIAVSGNLTLSSSDYIHINALSGYLDASDYVLFSVGTGTTMPTTPVLVWDGSAPGNYLNYSLLKVGNNLVLHYSSATAPLVTASVSPVSATRNQAVTVTANVTKGSGNLASVKVDLAQIGGSAAAGLVLDSAASTPSAYVYTNTFLVAASTSLGDKSLTVTATDNSSPSPLTGTYIITPLTITANAVTWVGGASDNQWTSNPNWTGNFGPGFVGDSVTFAGSTGLTPDMNTNYSVTGLTFDGTAGAFTLGSSTASTLTSGSGGIANNSTSAQTLNVPVVLSAAQTLNAAAGNLTLNSNVSLGANLLNVDGSANTTISGVISGTAGLTKAGAGTLVLSSANAYGNNGASDTAFNAGTLVIANDLALGSSRLNFADGVTIQSADSSAHIITNKLNFGSGAGGNTIFAGTGNLTFTASANNGTSKTLTVNNPQTEFGGVLSGNSARTVAGTGTLILSGANTYNGGTTINLGATLQLGNGGTNGSLSTSGVIDNEGTLKFNRSDALVQGVHFSSAPITGAGSVVQVGSGTTTLNAANTYTGLTTINNGELFITPAYQGGGDVVVANGAKFGISASSVTNSASIGNLTLGSGGATTLDFSYGLAGNPTNAALIANTVSINGTSTVRIGGSFAVGTFPVLKYGSLSGAFVGTVVAARGVTATLVNDTVNHVIKVTVSSVGSGIVWTGTNSLSPNLWDLNTTTNWLYGGLETAYLETVPPGDAVTFNDLGSGTVLLSNTVSPARVTLSNAAVNYTFQGSGQLNAQGGLTKVGAGTVTLNVPGTFGGSTVISNGTLSIGANQTVANLSGNGAVAVATGTPTLTVTNSQNTTFSGNVAGALTLTKVGAGELTMTGSNSLGVNFFVNVGAVTLDSGFMSANSYASVGHLGTDAGAMTLKGTANFTGNNDFNVGDVGASVGTLNLQDAATLTVNAFYVGSANATNSTASGTVNQTGGTLTQLNPTTGTFAIGGRVDTTSVGGVGVYNMSGGVLNTACPLRVGAGGTGTFNQSGGTVNVGVDVNLARFGSSAGTYNLNGGTLRTARVTSSTGVNATFNMNGGVLLATTDNTSIITNVTVNVRDGGAVVDTTNFNVSISSPLQHSYIYGDSATDGGLTKRGNGTLTLAESYSTYNGPTVVTAGALILSPGSVASLNSLTLSNGALGLTMNGWASYTATNLKLVGNSALNLNYDFLSSTPVVALNVGGGLTASGRTTLNVFGYGWTVGQFTLVRYTGTPLANLSNFALGALPYGVTASLSNNVANTSIDLVVTAVAAPTWIPLTGTDPANSSSFNSAGFWQDGYQPTAEKGYLTRTFAIRSPADTNAYSFGGMALSIDPVGRFIMKGKNGQTMTVTNLILNGGLVDYANGGDNFTETLAGNIILQGGLTSYLGALGSSGASETLFVTAPVSGSGNLQLGGANVNSGGDNGVVVLAGTNSYTGTTTVAGGTLLVNGANGNSPVTVNASATLGGLGSIAGPVTVQSGGTLAPGIPTRGALTTAMGTLTLSGSATIGGTVVVKLDRSATPTSDRLLAPAVVFNPGSTLVVTNLGSTNFVAGDSFALFSAPISGAVTLVGLPPLPSSDLYWTNKLATDGTIAVAAVATVNTSSTNITLTAAGGTLTLSWPADHLGWHLQVQTNSLSTGLGTNWVTIPGTEAVTSTNLTINRAVGSLFYRMVYP